MSKQETKSEQINSSMQLVNDYDDPITTQMGLLNCLKKSLGSNVSIMKYNKTKRVYVYINNGITHYFLTAAVTYLGNPHPLFKKRMQLKTWYKEFYNQYKDLPNTTVNILGVYHFDDMEIYCDFNIFDYINKKMNSSSAHVYTNDLFQAMKYDSFEKNDMNGNKITVIKGTYLNAYFNGQVTKNPVIELFEKFNSSFDFNKWLRADTCIQSMLENKWYQAKGTEWPGWFLEFKVDEFINHENCSSIMLYTGNKKKEEFDFDLYFGTLHFFGDLKASDISRKEAPGNDQINTINEIMKNGKLWYIIYEHETIKDKDHKNEMAINRMKLCNSNFKEGDHVSYKTRMKHSVNFKKMYILELNLINMHSILSDFNQGHNSGPYMKQRLTKFLISKNNINNSIIFSYKPNSK